jgi:crotonobetainyl-CoA:carnitine CoA-transferase CaiB-like acyl-CoA transferase
MTSQLPLQGYRVADFTQYVAGPSGTHQLAEMGAEVIKVEFAPGGDPTRRMNVVRDGRSTQYVQHNRGKKSLCVDLKTLEGRKILADLAATCDVFVQNATPGVVERMGVSYESLKAINPRIIMCSISAFGPEGPLATAPGFDWCGGAYAGAMSLIGNRDGAPTPPQMGLGDVATGSHAFAAIVCALLHRERTGEGQHIDVSLLDTWSHMIESAIGIASVAGRSGEPTRNGGFDPVLAACGTYKGVDKYFIILAPFDGQFGRLCEAFGHPEIMTDARFSSMEARSTNKDAVDELIEGWMRAASSDDELTALFTRHQVPAAPILSIREAIAHPHLRDRGTIRRIHDRVLGEFEVPGMPIRSTALGAPRELEAPALGEHNAEVLTQLLGYSPDEVGRLEAAGILRRAES